MTQMGAAQDNVLYLHTDPAGQRCRKVMVRDMVVETSIGVYDHEKSAPQRVRINLDLSVREGEVLAADHLDNVVCYEQIVLGIRRLCAEGHTNLVETLAEKIAQMCLADPRVRLARVRVEKLDVFADVGAVGVEIERTAATG